MVEAQRAKPELAKVEDHKKIIKRNRNRIHKKEEAKRLKKLPSNFVELF